MNPVQLPVLFSGRVLLIGSAWSLVYNGNPTYTNRDRTVTHTGADGQQAALGLKAIVETVYFEIGFDMAPVNGSFGVVMEQLGVSNTDHANNNNIGRDAAGVGYRGDGSVYYNFAAQHVEAGTFGTGSRVGVLVRNTGTRKVWFTTNGTDWYGATGVTDDPVTDTGGVSLTTPNDIASPIYAAVSLFTSASQASATLYSLPSEFLYTSWQAVAGAVPLGA